MRWRSRLGIIVVGLVAVLGGLFVFRRYASLLVLWALIDVPPLGDRPDEGASVRWFDDYYTVEALDPRTFAIGEPRYYQMNYNYLIVGDARAILFDSGPGVRDIRPLVASLTDLPVIAVPSHLHYDHLGNLADYDALALPDLPALRAREVDGMLLPTRWEHLGFLEGVENRPLPVTEWWANGQQVDLGGRTIRVFHTPGHTEDSISLFDAERRQLFSGDYLHPGAVFYFLPGGSLGDALRSADRLLASLPEQTRIYGAHRAEPPGAPALAVTDLRALGEALRGVREGRLPTEGYPVSFQVNDALSVLADLPVMESW